MQSRNEKYIEEFLKLREFCNGAYVPPPKSGPRVKCEICGWKRTTHRTLIMKEDNKGDYEPDAVVPCCVKCESQMMEV
jgi:hypothetical protein